MIDGAAGVRKGVSLKASIVDRENWIGQVLNTAARFSLTVARSCHTSGTDTASLFDAHTHPASIGMTGWHVRMGLPDYDGIISFITDYLAEHDAEEAPFVYFEYYP